MSNCDMHVTTEWYNTYIIIFFNVNNNVFTNKVSHLFVIKMQTTWKEKEEERKREKKTSNWRKRKRNKELYKVTSLYILSNVFSKWKSTTVILQKESEMTYCIPPWICQAQFTLEVKACKMDSEMWELVEQPWLQLMCCTICLLHGCNFQWKEEVQNGSEYWLVCHHGTLGIEFNRSYLCQLSD